jgi:hypothetical protein
LELDGRLQNNYGELADRGKLYGKRERFHPGNLFYGAIMIKATIDRFEGKMAVLIVGTDEMRLDVLRTRLPKGIREGTWLQVEIKDNEIISATIDEEEMARAKQRIVEKLAALRRGDHLKKNS